jgi:hypothetical protein
MVSSILKRVVALTACGFSAGNRTTSPAFNAMGLPATVTARGRRMEKCVRLTPVLRQTLF